MRLEPKNNYQQMSTNKAVNNYRFIADTFFRKLKISTKEAELKQNL